MRRTCRIAAALICVGLLTGAVTGCFGSGEEAADTTVATTSTTGTTDSSSATSTSLATPTTVGPSTLVDGIPSEFANAFGKRPIVVLFYAPGGVDDEKVLTALRSLTTSFSSYTILTYDYRVPAAYGDLSQRLKVGYMPQIVMIDSHGAQRDVWTGYIDKLTLNQSLLTLGSY